jgi:Kae1-associated kinase Bud32
MVNRISEGAEAFIYRGNFLGLDAVIKSRIRKGYRIKEMDERIRATRTKKEARILSIASDSGVLAPTVLFVDRYNICMSEIKGRNLNSLLKLEKDVDGVFYQLGVYAGMLHKAGIAHGDYTPANVMVDNAGKAWIIDFGLSEMTGSFEEGALDLLLMKRAISAEQFRTFEMGYKKQRLNAMEVLRRLAEIERRGRYQTRTLSADEG